VHLAVVQLHEYTHYRVHIKDVSGQLAAVVQEGGLVDECAGSQCMRVCVSMCVYYQGARFCRQKDAGWRRCQLGLGVDNAHARPPKNARVISGREF
jgi:hypothetical protein